MNKVMPIFLFSAVMTGCVTESDNSSNSNVDNEVLTPVAPVVDQELFGRWQTNGETIVIIDVSKNKIMDISLGYDTAPYSATISNIKLNDEGLVDIPIRLKRFYDASYNVRDWNVLVGRLVFNPATNEVVLDVISEKDGVEINVSDDAWHPDSSTGYEYGLEELSQDFVMNGSDDFVYHGDGKFSLYHSDSGCSISATAMKTGYKTILDNKSGSAYPYAFDFKIDQADSNCVVNTNQAGVINITTGSGTAKNDITIRTALYNHIILFHEQSR